MAKAKNTDMVVIERKQAITTSLKVAEYFEKNHQHVMRDIRKIEEEMDVSKFGQMFRLSSYSDSYGREQPMYLMNHDGFMFVVMGFTGKKATDTKLAFIEQFHAMEKVLQNWQDPKWQKIRRTGIDFGRKPCMEQIHKFNERDFADGDKDPRGKARFGRYTNRTQKIHAGIPAGGRDSASGAELAALLAGERASATIFAREFAKDSSYSPAENKAVKTFKGIYDLIFNNEYLENPPAPQLLTA